MVYVIVSFIICVVVLNNAFSQEKLVPFHLRFFGKSTDGFEVVFPQYNVTFRKAVKLCVNVCEDPWWCSALHKCADRPRTFQCDVICLWKSESMSDKPAFQHCILSKANQIGPNVAANKTVRIVMDRAYVKQLPEYGTDTITMCPLNVLLVHTLRVHNPWIKILFDQMVDVTLVVIYNRQSSFGNRLHDVHIQVANGDVWRPCGFYKGPGENHQIIFITCDESVRGNILMIKIQSMPNAKDFLHVCEIEVFEKV